MASQLWSWIFIIQIMLVQPGYAHVGHYKSLTRRALVQVFARGLTEAEITAKNTFTALAITLSVVLVVGLIGLFLVIQRSRRQVKVPEPEAGVVDAKPSWWMVEGKNEKMDWWRLSHRLEPTAVPDVDPTQPVDGGRIARLKAAIQRQAGKNAQPIIPMYRTNSPSPTGSLGLPMQSVPDVQPKYPDSLERGYRAPIYPVQSPPQVPQIYVGERPLTRKSPTSPPRAIVTGGQRATLARAGARSGAPRSPAGRRRDLLHRHSFRNPFLPLKVPESPLKISDPIPLPYIDTTNPKLAYGIGLLNPRAAPTPPGDSNKLLVPPKLRKLGPPAPLNLDNRQPLSAARIRVGLPTSPRPTRTLNSAF